MPQGIYKKIECKGERQNEFEATKHQRETLNFFLSNKAYKGILLYHKLGSGKTCTSIMIADKMLKRKMVKHIYILTPGSLRKGWISEYCKVCGHKPRYLRDFFTFITYNYNVGKIIRDINFDNSLVIIDEVHNLINGVKNQSKNPVIIYNKLSQSNCRILSLSGTPIFNYVYEWPLLGNLLKPGTFPNIVEKDGEINQTRFLKDFIEEENGTLIPKNPTKMKRSLEGIVSYFPGKDQKFYPKVIHMEPIKVEMTQKQQQNYFYKQEIQQMFIHKPSEEKKRKDPDMYKMFHALHIMAIKDILIRSASNFCYPYEIKRNEQLSTDIESIFKAPKDTLTTKGGWVDKEEFKDKKLLTVYSPKFTAVIVNIVMHKNQKHVVFSFFKTKGGLVLLQSMFELMGIKSLIFSGDIDDRKRESILRRFNDNNNLYGEKIPVLLVTEAGAEGITLKNTRHMHILESNPRENKIQQAMGRIVRYKSHIDLPKKYQTVKIWRYWSVFNGSLTKINKTLTNTQGKKQVVGEKTIDTSSKLSIDEKLYRKGQIQLERVNSFLKLIQEVSVT